MKTKTLLIVSIVVFLFLIGIAFFVLNKFVFKSSEVPDDLLDDSKLSDEDKEKVKTLTEELKSWLDTNYFFRGSEVPTKLVNQSDTIFVSIFNEFAVYEGKTLKQWFSYINWHEKNRNAVLAVRQRFKTLEDKGITFDEAGKILKLSLF